MKKIKHMLLLALASYAFACDPPRVLDTSTGYISVVNPTDTFTVGDTLHLVLHRPDSAWLFNESVITQLHYEDGDKYSFSFDFYVLDSNAVPKIVDGLTDNILLTNNAQQTYISRSFASIESNGADKADIYFVMNKPGIYFLYNFNINYAEAHYNGARKKLKTRLTWYFETTNKQFYLLSPYKFQYPDSTWHTYQEYAQYYADDGRDGYAFAVKAK